MNDGVNELTQSYDKALKAGQKFIGDKWKWLKQETQDNFLKSGCWDNRGRRLEESEPNDDIENIEYQIGTLYQCASYTLPDRSDVGVIITSEAFSENILAACDELLFRPQWHDPVFLRLALNAFRTHQMANQLISLPPQKITNSKFLGIKFLSIMTLGVLLFLATYLSPFLIGSALVSAIKGDLESTVFTLYVLGFAIWTHFLIKNISESEDKPKSQDEKYYDAWHRLSPWGVGSWLSTGAGARFYFQDMVNNGANVPPLAIDLCAALEASVFMKQLDGG